MRFFFCRFLSECAIGCLLEVMREQYTEFYKEKEQWRYLKKMDTNHKLLSLEGFTDSEGNMLDFIVDEATIEQIRTDDRADFNSNRRFYRCQTRRGGWRNSGAGGRRKKSTWLLC